MQIIFYVLLVGLPLGALSHTFFDKSSGIFPMPPFGKIARQG